MDRDAVSVPEDRQLFRAGVGLVVLDRRGRVLALERKDVPGAWQLPQGGLEPGEDTEAAAWRELGEETGIGREHVSLRRVSEVWLGYELPREMRSPKTGRGQVHKWFLFEMKTHVGVPALPNGREAEFVNCRWVTFPELLAAVVDFRRPTYEFLSAWVNDPAKG